MKTKKQSKAVSNLLTGEIIEVENFDQEIEKQTKHLVVEKGFNCWVCYFGGDKMWFDEEIKFENTHRFIEDLSKEFLEQPIKIQEQIIKILFANKLSWRMAQGGNTKYGAVFSKVYTNLRNAFFEDKKIAQKHKTFCYRFLD